MTQVTLARKLAVTATTVARWERGEQVIGRPGAVLLALDQLEGLRMTTTAATMPIALARTTLSAGDKIHNLPAEVSSFLGRERELHEITDLLSRERLVTISGTGGVGKTRLALEAAAQVLPRHQDGVWFIDLSTVRTGHDVGRTVAGALGVPEQGRQPVLETLCLALLKRNLLLVLDNCEHVLPDCVRVVYALLTRCPSVGILTTTRERLGIMGEFVYELKPLRLPDDDPQTDVGQTESVRLFVQRAREVLPTFALTDANVAEVVYLCRRLEGIPLALELAAARVQALGVTQLARRLDDQLTLLVSNSGIEPDRHHTVNAAIDWSYRLLSSAEQRLFNRLSVFVGGWTAEAAESVVADNPAERGAIVELLCQLVGKSLVIAETTAEGVVRYRQLQMLRQYAAEHLPHAGEATAIQSRHASYYLGLAEQTRPQVRMYEVRAALDHLEIEHDNFRAALDWCVEHQEVESALRLVSALWPFWYVGGYVQEGWARLERVAVMPGADAASHLRARILYGCATLAYRRGEFCASEAFAEECLALSRTSADRALIAATLTHLGNLAHMTHRFARARALLEVAVEETRLANRPAMEVDCLLHLARLDWLQGDLGAVQLTLNRALSLASGIGDTVGVIGALRGLGELAYRTADLGSARVLLEECVEHASQLGDRWRVAWAPLPLGYVLVDSGDDDRASAIWGTSLHLWRDLGNMSQLASVIEAFGYQAARRGQVRRALMLHFAAAVIRRSQSASILPEAKFWLDRWLASAVALVSDVELAILRARGESLSVDDAIAYALRRDRRAPQGNCDRIEPRSILSRREIEVVQLIVLGSSDREIAETLVLSQHTVHSHVRNILHKLQLRRRVQIATWGLANNHDQRTPLRIHSINHQV